MRITSSDPDLETIYNRILRGDIVFPGGYSKSNKWDEPKRQKLVDTIMRGWHIPSVFLIEDEYSDEIEVLDGYQRLSVIADFIEGWIVIDGSIEPESWLKQYDGFKFEQLPEVLQKRINSFSINCLVVSDFSAGEPGEFVKRLNSREPLTGAEQRSLSHGRVRSQIKSFVSTLNRYDLGKDFFGFSNARMAYDDVLGRVAITIEEGGFKSKLTSDKLLSWYNSDKQLSDFTIDTMGYVVDKLHEVNFVGSIPKFNKATLTSWLMFLSRAHANNIHVLDPIIIHDFLNYFDNKIRLKAMGVFNSDSLCVGTLLEMYVSRSRTRVDEVSALVLRDAAIWVVFYQYLMDRNMTRELELPSLDGMMNALVESIDFISTEDEVSTAILDSGWGDLTCR